MKSPSLYPLTTDFTERRELITIEQYCGNKISHPDCKPEYIEAAAELLSLVNALLLFAESCGKYDWQVDPDTGTCISGSRGGSGDGGFRLQSSKTGAINSRHRFAKAVDVYDPGNILDSFITDDLLVRFKLWREHQSATPGWTHLQSVAPGSGSRSFLP